MLGQEITDAEFDKRRTAVAPGDLATLIYTSGTTGRPKGCKISHSNFLAELDPAVKVLDDLFDADGASTLLFLPLAHVFARIIQVGCVMMRVKVGHSADVKNLVDDLGDVQADLHPERAAGVREGVQLGQPEGARRRQGQDLRRRRGHRDRVLAGAGQGRRVVRAEGQARAVRPARLRQAPHGARRPGPVRRLRRRAARRPARPLLPRHRRTGAGGLRPDRDHRRGGGEPARRHPHRHRGPAASWCDGRRRGRRRAAASRAAR